MKIEPLPSSKSSTKLIPKVTRGFVSAHSPCWLTNSQRKVSRCWLRNNHLKTFQRWCVDSEVLVAPVDLEKVNENWVGADWKSLTKQLPKVTPGFVSAPSPCWLSKSKWKLSHYCLRNHQQNWFVRWRVDSSEPTAPVDSEIVNDKWVVADSKIITENSFQRWCVDSKALAAPVDSDKVNKNGVGADWEIVNETPSTGDG